MTAVMQTDRPLLARDNPLNQDVAPDMLDLTGFKADVVNNGAEVLQTLERNACLMIVMDCKCRS